MPNWFVQGMRRMRALVWINIVPKVLFILVVFFIIKSPKEAFIYPLSISLSSVIVALLSVFWVHRAYAIPFRISLGSSTWNLLKKERWIFLSGLINNTNQTFNVLILGFFVSFESVGHFTLGWRLMNVTQVLVMFPIMQSLFLVGEEIKEPCGAWLDAFESSHPLCYSRCIDFNYRHVLGRAMDYFALVWR